MVLATQCQDYETIEETRLQENETIQNDKEDGYEQV